MNKIKVMDELLANKIAAGEVVEKCVSVVKELVENSIDANASEIKIELKEAGIREIKVTDNGTGMSSRDALLAFQRHATSKLLRADDLFHIASLGFRGEALPSIASVSEVVLKTCQDDVGTLIHIKGGKVLENTSCEARVGTSIVVSNLFYNTPARLKHLSSIYSELANITDYVNKIALSYPNIKFVLIHEDKELLNTDGSGNLLKVIHAIYGHDITKKMLEINGENDDYKISGYISMPEVNRSSKNYMTVIVNGRVIKNSALYRVINDSYGNYKEDTRYPIVVLKIDTDPTLIDVNVHPSKLDIKFSNFDDLKLLIRERIIDVISSKLLIPKIEEGSKDREINYRNLTLDLSRNKVNEDEGDYYQRLSSLVNMNNHDDEMVSVLEEKIDDDNNMEDVYVEDVCSKDRKLPDMFVVGQVLGTYIVCENQYGMYLIDQHAAQERVNYEKFTYFLAHPSKNKIDLLVPMVIELTSSDFLLVKKNIDIILNLNIDISEFGVNSFRITSHPTWFPKYQPDKVIRGIIEQIISLGKDFDIEKFNKHLAATMACKASVKGNTRVTFEVMESLILELRKCKNPFNCPHGRPTIIEFTTYEVEKMFKRSV